MSNEKHYDMSLAVAEYYEFPGRDHWTCAALDWAWTYAETDRGASTRRSYPQSMIRPQAGA